MTTRKLSIRERFNNPKAIVFLVMMGAFSSTPAYAGVPVIDVAGLIQSILSVLDEITQIENQISQIENQVDHYKSITGSRNLGEIFNNPALQNYIPTTALESYDKLKDGYSGLSGAAKALRDANMIYNCVDIEDDAARARCQQTFAKPYEQQAEMQKALKATDGRLAQIKSLMSQINATTDEKAIEELNARIAAENAMLEHEQSRALLLQGVYDADARAEANRKEEERLRAHSRTGSIMDKVSL